MKPVMKCAVLLCMLIVLRATSSPAAETEAAAPPDTKAQPAGESAEAPQPKIVERQLEFEESKEEYEMHLDTTEMRMVTLDPKLSEQRYVAVVQATGNKQFEVFCHSWQSSHGRSRGGGPRPPSPSNWFKATIVAMSPDEVPSKDIVTAFSTDIDRHLTIRQLETAPSGPEVSGEPTGGRQPIFELRVLAPDAQRAKKLTRELLRLIDARMVYSATGNQYLAIKRYRERQLPELRASLAAAETEHEALKKEMERLDEYKDINRATLDNFITQQRLISVELVGINARIAACEKILADGKAHTATRIQVETAKVAAEIELVGVAARKNAIGQIVTKGQEFLQVSGRLSAANGKVLGTKNRIESCEREVKSYADRLKRLTPSLREEPIVIHPIKWASR